MIPSNITQDDCFRAVRVIDNEGVPDPHRSKKFDVLIGSKRYPPKWVIHVANQFANGSRYPTSDFSGGTESNTFLSGLGFTIRRKSATPTKDYLFRWLPDSVSHRFASGKPLDFVASSQLGKIEPGDRVWIVTSRENELILVGVIPVESVGDFSHATKKLGYEPDWKAKFYAIGPVGRAARPVEINIGKIANTLRFVSKRSVRLNMAGNIAQQLQTMRQLDGKSAQLLSSVLDKSDPLGISGASRNGAGFGDPETNKRVEKAAIDHVTTCFKSKGYFVDSKEIDRIGYDLLCTKHEQERHVEVKGVSGKYPAFIVTANEVVQATNDAAWEIAVVTLALTSPTITNLSGKEFLSRYNLHALQFRAVPKT